MRLRSKIKNIGLILSCLMIVLGLASTFFTKPAYAEKVDIGIGKITVNEESGHCTGDEFDIPGPKNIPNPMSWFVCAITNATGSALNMINSAVKEMFEFNPIKDGGDDSPLYGIWKRMRDVANIFFIVGLMIIVISQALDFSIFSNYTIKKMLPKLLLGIVLANLSWVFCEIIINVFNLMGNLIGGFILQPAISVLGGDSREISAKLALDEPTQISLKGGTNVILATIISHLIIALLLNPGAAIVLLILIFVVGIIIAIIAFFTLAIRRVFIVVLIVLAPLACAAWALPNGDKLFSKWWKWFMDMMIMYVYVQIFVALGVFVGAIMITTPILQNDNAFLDGMLNQINSIIALCVLILPYGMIPVAFRMASKTLGTVQGKVNGALKGGVRAGMNKGRERYKNSEFSMRRQAEKGVRQGAKQQRAESAARENILASRDGTSRRDRRRRRGMTDDDMTVLQTEVAANNLRVPQALDKQRQIEQAAAARTFAGAINGAEVQDAAGNTHTIGDGAGQLSTDKLYEAIAKGQAFSMTDRDGNRTTVGGNNEAHQEFAMNHLAANGRDQSIRNLRADGSVNQVTLSQAINNNVSSLINKAPDVVKGDAAAFEGSLSAQGVSAMSADTVRAATTHLAGASPEKQQAFVNEIVNLVNDERAFNATSQATAQALLDHLNSQPVVDVATAKALRAKTGSTTPPPPPPPNP